MNRMVFQFQWPTHRLCFIAVLPSSTSMNAEHAHILCENLCDVHLLLHFAYKFCFRSLLSHEHSLKFLGTVSLRTLRGKNPNWFPIKLLETFDVLPKQQRHTKTIFAHYIKFKDVIRQCQKYAWKSFELETCTAISLRSTEIFFHWKWFKGAWNSIKWTSGKTHTHTRTPVLFCSACISNEIFFILTHAG